MVSSPKQRNSWETFLIAIIISFGGVGLGLSLSWTATALPSIDKIQQVGHALTSIEKSLISSILNAGALIACPITAYGMNTFGRKSCLLYLCLVSIPGWIVLASGTTNYHLFVGRILTGFYAGGSTVVVPVYLKEISSSSNRGMLGSLFLVMICVGKLISNSIGYFFDARLASLLCTIQPILHGIMLLFIPDSPISAYSHKQTEISIKPISGSTSEPTGSQNKSAKFQYFQPIMSVFVLILLSQVTGINVVTFFTNELVQHESSSQLINPNNVMIILSSIQVIGGLPTSIFVDKCGRKCLLLSSLVTMSVSLGILSVYYYITDLNNNLTNSCINQQLISLVPLFFLATYSLSYSWGVGSVVWILMSEMIPPKLIAPVSSIANIIYWTLAFLITLLYQLVNIPLYVWFTGFLVACLSGIVYIFMFVPETKMLNLEQEQENQA